MASRVSAVAVMVLWLVTVLDALPRIELLGGSRDLHMLFLVSAATGTIALFIRRTQRPVEEIFDAGREYERRVMLKEMNARTVGAKVVPIRKVPNGLAAFNKKVSV